MHLYNATRSAIAAGGFYLPPKQWTHVPQAAFVDFAPFITKGVVHVRHPEPVRAAEPEQTIALLDERAVTEATLDALAAPDTALVQAAPEAEGSGDTVVPSGEPVVATTRRRR